MSVGGTRARTVLLVALGLLALVAGVWVLGPPPSVRPYDPAGTDASGLGGMVELLRELDVEVEVSAAPPASDGARALVVVDRLGEDDRAEWRRWVADGGHLVVADPDSPLADVEVLGADRPVGRSSRRAACPLLDDLGPVTHGDWVALAVPDGAADACFPDGEDAAWLLDLEDGAGRRTVLGSPTPLTNGELWREDNAVLAAALLGPAPGDQLIIVPPEPAMDADEGGLLELIHPGVWRVGAALVLALLLAVWGRARRDGRVVTEPLPPVLPSAQLARSLAGLLQRRRDPADAAARLRRHLRREVSAAIGAGPDADPDHLARMVAARTAVSAQDARAALSDQPVPDDDALVELAAAVQRVLEDLHRPPPAATGDDDGHDEQLTRMP